MIMFHNNENLFRKTQINGYTFSINQQTCSRSNKCPYAYLAANVPCSSCFLLKPSFIRCRHSMPIMLLLLLLLGNLQRPLTPLWVHRLNILWCLHTLASDLCQLEVTATFLRSDEDGEDNAECDDGGGYTHDWTVGWSNLDSS